MPRRYSMERRTAAVDETRQRIVDATVELHNEKGVLATSMQDIAARAGVSLGTVYRHFPSIDELVPACGGRSLELNPLPTPEVFAQLDSGPDRIRSLFDALFAHYESMERPYFVGRAEASHLPVLQTALEQAEGYLRSLIREAVEPFAPSEEGLGIAIAMADFYTWYAFTRAGFTSAQAAATASDVVIARLSSGESGV
jgi:AcrR family transcriptional regulator